MAQSGQAPEPGQNAGFLHKDSVGGSKIISEFGGIDLGQSISLNAYGDGGGLDYGAFHNYLTVLDPAGKVVPYSNIIPLVFATYYVDGYTSAYVYNLGASAGTYKLRMSQHLSMINDTGIWGIYTDVTHFHQVIIRNEHSSPHTIYQDAEWRLIRTRG